MATTKTTPPSKSSEAANKGKKTIATTTKKTTENAAKSTTPKSKNSTAKTASASGKTTMKKNTQSAPKDNPEPISNAPTKKRASLIATLKDKLIKEREELLHGLGRKESSNEISSHGDLVDQSTNFSEHEVMLGLAEHDRNRLQEINHALEKIEKGTYGICEMSGELISDERLMAMPTARYSVKCQAKMEGYG